MTAVLSRPALDIRNADAIPMSRLVRVELRKLVDTRAGFWLTASIGVVSVIVGTIMLISNRNTPEDLNFGNIFGNMNVPTAILLPVLAILLVTGEWSQRNALTTFTLEPRRERVVIAKLATAVIAGLAAVGLALVLGAVGNVLAIAIYGDPAGSWSFGAAGLVNSFTIQIFGLLNGFAFAALILNTPGSIVAYFAFPTVMSMATELIPWFKTNLADWIDPMTTSMPFQSSDWVSGGEWLRMVVSIIIWIAIPLTLGVIRVLRTEVK